MTTNANFESYDSRLIIQESEAVIEALRAEVHFFKSECDSSKSKIIYLVNENNELSTKLNELAKSFDSTLSVEHQFIESDLINNLKQQIECLAKEKESVTELWQNALRTSEYLEDELRIFEGKTHGYIPKSDLEKVRKTYESQVKILEEQLKECKAQLNNISQTFMAKLESKNADLEKALREQTNIIKVVTKLEQELQESREKQHMIEEIRNTLEQVLKEKDKQISELRKQENISRAKVIEAVEVVESALFEKDEALMREGKAKEEILKMSRSMSDEIKETTEKAEREIVNIKNECNEKIVCLNEELKNAQEELRFKIIELEKSSLKCEMLEREISIYRTENGHINENATSKLLVLEKNLEATFQKLLLSERKNLQLTSEKENIKADLEQMAGHFERDIRSRELEKRGLEHKIKNLQKELEMTSTDLATVTSKLEKLLEKIKYLENEVQKQWHLKMMYEKTAEKFTQVEATNSKMYADLEQYLELQITMNKKWKSEAYRIQKVLERRLHEVKQENLQLKNKLIEAENKIIKYKISLEKFCTDVNKIAGVKVD